VFFFLYCSLASYLHLALNSGYINRRIGQPIFAQHNPYRYKAGHSVSFFMRTVFMIFSLAMVPMLVNLYLPVAANWYLLDMWDKLQFSQLSIVVPLLCMAIITVVFLAVQVHGIFAFYKGLQQPLDRLMERMRGVQKGDFTTKIPVLGSDEISRLGAFYNDMIDGLVEREKMRDTFGKYVSMEIAEKIIRAGHVHLEGEEIEATIMFTDIRNFTTRCEGLSPQDAVRFLNDYFMSIARPLETERGVINKFIGDSIMAFFSPVFGIHDHAAAALRSAIGMRAALEEFNRSGTYPETRHGIGLHTGRLVAGNVGTRERMEYTLIGDVVNIASRIESETKNYKTDILLSESTYQQINTREFDGIVFAETEPVLMKGKSTTMRLFKVQ
jgi:adenylate cyclase